MLFVVTLSLGESVWSPRWYDYSMSLAPEGREGIFTALASAPLFAAKLPTGEASPSLRLRRARAADHCQGLCGDQFVERRIILGIRESTAHDCISICRNSTVAVLSVVVPSTSIKSCKSPSGSGCVHMF